MKSEKHARLYNNGDLLHGRSLPLYREQNSKCNSNTEIRDNDGWLQGNSKHLHPRDQQDDSYMQDNNW